MAINGDGKMPKAMKRDASIVGVVGVRGPVGRLAGWGAWGLIVILGLVGCEPAPRGAGSNSVAPGEIVTFFGDPLPADASLRDILQHPDSLERATRVAQILQRSGPERLETLRTAFEEAALDRGDIEYELFGDWWARFDPKAAFAFAESNLRTDHLGVGVAIARAWARTDPQGAVDSGFLGHDPLSPGFQLVSGMRIELLDALVVGWFESGNPGLEEWIQGLTKASDISRALRTYARIRVIHNGDEETLAWTRQPTFSPTKQRLLLAGALSVISRQNPQLAAGWMKIAEEDGVDIRTFMPRIAHGWARHQPLQALEWVGTFPDGPERTRSVARVGHAWLKQDEEAVARWLDTRVGEAWTDALRFSAVRFHVKHHDYRVDWPRLMERSEQIVGRDQSLGNLSWVLQRWLVADPPGAEAWIESHPDSLPEKSLERARGISPKERAEIESALAAVTAD